ncbi:MAG: ABC transporter permease subunit [Gemmatimonadetes bacterium]|nr:ABC transporter permease subunit [Gemmatimonadota bacterium]
MRRSLRVACLLAATVSVAHAQAPRPIVVASKPFGESYILAELFAQLLESRGIAVDRRPGLASTDIAFGALRNGDIDVYPEYTGTGLLAVLKDSMPAPLRANPQATFAHVAREFAQRYGVLWLPPLGFENTYAIAVRRETAAQHQLRTLSDLARAGGELRAGFTADFIGRPDGLRGLASHYGLTPREVRPLAPAVKYEALATGGVDVIDGYSTDGLLARYDLVVLEDDRRFFPPYEAAALVSPEVARTRPDVVAALGLLSGRIGVAQMRAWNRALEVDREELAAVARRALGELGLVEGQGTPRAVGPERGDNFWGFFWARRAETARLFVRHLLLVVVALGAAILVAVPVGLFLERRRAAAGPILAALGVLQTIPSIALLAFMIPLLGVGIVPALVALWLYALYPIARNTFTGVRDADVDAVEALEALGATPRQRLAWVRLPLAVPVILAGVRTAAVITVGAATLAAFVGAGGLGDPIVAGLALADTRLVFSGAIPAALLAVVVDLGLAQLERILRPAHLRRVARPS